MVSTSRRGRGQVGSRRQPGLSDGAPTLGTVLDWADDPRVRWVHRSPAVPGETAAWPSWLPPSAVARFQAAGVQRPWRHQVEAADALFEGRHVALATGTASGKTLAYLMPVLAAAEAPVTVQPELVAARRGAAGASTATSILAALAEARVARRPGALYIAPTKALAHDQLRVCRDLGPDDWRASALDGDSTDEERRFAREFATYVLTNPDMLHRAVLPNHQRWRSLLASLQVVVVDEAHRYRGVFGAHVGAVLRRLRRLCHAYGADPVFCCASATAANAVAAASLLTGVSAHDIVGVADDSSARGARTVVVREPSDTPDPDAADVLADLVDAGLQTLTFVSSRRGAELVALRAQKRLTTDRRVAAYRGGFLAHDRRDLERGLQSGALAGLATTNALELGVDVSGMDAVVIAGLPGTTASLWQQAGRAGRRGGRATVVVVPRANPLDVHVTESPARLLGAPVEEVVLHPDNPAVLGPHLVAASQESPLVPADERWFGAAMTSVLAQQVSLGTIRTRASGWFCAVEGRAVDRIDLRSAGGSPYEVIEATTGRILGTCDAATSDAMLHPGAVYLHQGDPWLVDRLDDDGRQAWVHAERTGFFTSARTETAVRVVGPVTSRVLPGSAGLTAHQGRVEVTSRVYAYLRRDDHTGKVLDQRRLDRPERLLESDAVWLTLASEGAGAGTDAALHAAEHVLLAMLGAVAPCDRWDVAGRSWLAHAQLPGPSVMVWDRQSGGSGFARAGFGRAEAWVEAAAQRLVECGCERGCPRCCLTADCDAPERALDPVGAAHLLGGQLPS